MRFEPDSKDTFEESPLSFKDSLDIQGVCLRILCNFRGDKPSIAQAIKKSIKFLFKSAKFDSIDQIRFACDVTGALIDLLKDDDYIETILELMKEYKILKELRKMANKVSDRTISAKPHAFDFIKYSYLDDAELRAANEAITEDVSHEVDVVKESYQRELVNKIFRIINFFIETSHSNPEYSRMVKGSEIYTNIFTQPPSKRTKKFFRTIQRSVLKWMNFELEPQISSEIFDTIIAVDSLLPDSGYKKNTEEIPMSKTNDIFLDLCLEVLPFFTHLKEKDFGPVYRLETQVGEIQEAIGDKNQHISETFLEHIYSIYNLVLLLIKINGLINRKDHPDPKSLAKAYSFVCVIYMCITEAVEHSEFAMALSKFSSDLLMLGWQNKSCNEQHIELLLILMKKSKSTKLNIDS